MTDKDQNSLLASVKSSESSLNVQLHPLVLLTISDHITRHKLRKQQVPIVGAILGQQIGRELTMEVAFQCKLLTPEDQGEGMRTDGTAFMVDDEWFRDRLEQCMQVLFLCCTVLTFVDSQRSTQGSATRSRRLVCSRVRRRAQTISSAYSRVHDHL